MSLQATTGTGRVVRFTAALVLLLVPAGAGAQHDHGSARAPAPTRPEHVEHDASHLDSVAMRHMVMTPRRAATAADSARASTVLAAARRALARYVDTSAAIADGYRPFLPGAVPQRVHHYTRTANAFKEAFRFDPAQPTSLLYVRGPDGRLALHGAMYTAPRRMSAERLDARIPLSIATWHKHVDWCVPPRGAAHRWTEARHGRPVFGPLSPIATAKGCEAVGGRFRENVFGWMVHVNAFAEAGREWEH